MNGILIILFLLTVVFLPIVIIKPSILEKVTGLHLTRLKAGLLTGVVAFVLFMLVGATASPAIKEVAKNKPAPIQVTENSPSQPPTPKYIFDVPSLIGKTIDKIRTVLGDPADQLKEPNAQQIKLGVVQWDNTFKKEGKELLVTYNVKTRKVVDLFISTDDPSGKTSDKNHLLELGNLIENAVDYKIEFVKTIKDPANFTGIKVTPK